MLAYTPHWYPNTCDPNSTSLTMMTASAASLKFSLDKTSTSVPTGDVVGLDAGLGRLGDDWGGNFGDGGGRGLAGA